jgi:hypothetical protein
MKPGIALLLLLVVASANGAEAPADGLYRTVQDTSSLWFPISGEQNAAAAARQFGVPVAFMKGGPIRA